MDDRRLVEIKFWPLPTGAQAPSSLIRFTPWAWARLLEALKCQIDFSKRWQPTARIVPPWGVVVAPGQRSGEPTDTDADRHTHTHL